MPVDTQIQEILDFIESRQAPPVHELPPPEARVAMAKARALLQGDAVALARIENRSIPGPGGDLPVRIYADSVGTPLPLLVYFHGGGWVIGDLDTHDDVCRRLARRAGCLVVSVGYRLAPEHKFPAAVDDAYAAVSWLARHALEMGADPTRVAVGGDSAGGNLSAVVAQLARDRGGPSIKFQLLVYPVTTQDYGTASMHDNAQGYFLTVDGMKYFWHHYLNTPREAQDPLASPLQASSLAGLPPAFILTAEYDPLRDEGEAYGARLREAGVPVTVRRYAGAVHGFFTFSKTLLSHQAMDEVSAALRTALALE